MNIDLTAILAQLPMVAILLFLILRMSDKHEKAIDQYRAQLDAIIKFLMENHADLEQQISQITQKPPTLPPSK